MQHLLSNFREKNYHTSQVEKLYDLWVCTYFYMKSSEMRAPCKKNDVGVDCIFCGCDLWM